MKSILVIEGDEMVRRFLRTALESSHYSVMEAATDVDGMALAANGRVGVIVLDCMGTHAGGLRTLKALRNNPVTANVPVIAMTGLGQYGYDLPLWANACLVKPFRPSQLIRKIEALAPVDLNARITQEELVPALAVAGL